MSGTARRIEARVFASLPAELHHRGPPTEWVKVTRPGMQLHSFIEGPCPDAAGNLWLVDVPYGRIFRVDPAGDWSLVHQYDGEPHAIRIRPDGRFIIADHRRGLLAFDPVDKGVEVICTDVNTEPFRGLSDLAIASNGDIWFTDPGRSSLSDPTGRVLRLRQGESAPQVVLANVPYPNGVALGADGRRVFVSATRANAVWSLLAEAPDPVFPMAGVHIQLSGGLGPDGLATSASGLLAVAQAQAGRAYLFDAVGDMIADIRTPSGNWTTACTFGPDGSELFILEAETAAIFRADLGELKGPA